MKMVAEDVEIEKDILTGRGMDVLFCLMDNAHTKIEIATRLNMPNYSVQLYLNRLEKAGLIKEDIPLLCNGQIEKKYQLISDEIEIINYLQNNNLSDSERMKRVELSAQHFALMTRNAIKNVNLNSEKPHKIKAYFMKANEEDMKNFREEISQLFERYQKLEDKTAKDSYSLFTVLAPYEMEE